MKKPSHWNTRMPRDCAFVGNSLTDSLVMAAVGNETPRFARPSSACGLSYWLGLKAMPYPGSRRRFTIRVARSFSEGFGDIDSTCGTGTYHNATQTQALALTCPLEVTDL
jgi:hypothetical protein